MAFKFNPFTGNFDLVNDTTTDLFVPRPLITLTSGDIIAGSLDIVVTPSDPTLTRLTIGGIRHTYGTDFTVSGSTLTWSGLGLDGILEAGDIIQLEII